MTTTYSATYPFHCTAIDTMAPPPGMTGTTYRVRLDSDTTATNVKDGSIFLSVPTVGIYQIGDEYSVTILQTSGSIPGQPVSPVAPAPTPVPVTTAN